MYDADDEDDGTRYHMSSDMIGIDAPGHENHKVVKFRTGQTAVNKPAQMTAICSCGTSFRLSSKPRLH